MVNRYIDSTAKKTTVDIQANQLSVSAGSANTHYDLMEPLYGRIMSSLAELTFVDKLVLFCTVLCRLRKSSVEKIDLNEVYNVIVDVLHHNCDNSPMISNLLLTYSTIKTVTIRVCHQTVPKQPDVAGRLHPPVSYRLCNITR